MALEAIDRYGRIAMAARTEMFRLVYTNELTVVLAGRVAVDTAL
jgi:hypothetical protein